MISTRSHNGLPDVAGLRRLLQSMAMLDAILSPAWESRYYSFNAHWAAGRQMGSMRDGSGDHFFALFDEAGCFFKGFAHEAPMSPFERARPGVWPSVLDSVPAEFVSSLEEPAFAIEETTFCLWRRNSDASWQVGAIDFPAGPDPDGSLGLLAPLDGRPETYRAWAEGYYEQDVGLAEVRHVYAHKPLTRALVSRLNPNASMVELAADIEEIGYPTNSGERTA